MKTTFFLARIPPNLPTFFRKGIQHNQFSVHLSTYSSIKVKNLTLLIIFMLANLNIGLRTQITIYFNYL